jgi:hypothetical protein
MAAKKNVKNPMDMEAMRLRVKKQLERAVAHDQAVDRILKLAVPWAHEIAAQPALSTLTRNLVKAVLRYEKLK